SSGKSQSFRDGTVLISRPYLTDRMACFWLALAGTVLVAGFAVLSLVSWRFGYAFEVIEMPVLTMVGLLVLLGIVFCVAALLVARLATSELRSQSEARTLGLVLVVGILARLVLIPSTPVLEDDYQRYLWDGAVSAQGINPYSVVPAEALETDDPALEQLAANAGLVLERVNHPEIRTIYPPASQLFFVLAHAIEPFSLHAWRTVVLLADGVTLVLVLALLRLVQRPLIWSAIYWWNPVIIKELANSVHMDAVLMPFVLGAIYLATQKRPLLATAAIGIGAGIKIWPLVLFPLIVRAAAERKAILIASCLLLSGMVALWAFPMIVAGLDRSAGVVAFAEKWQTNSAFLVVLSAITGFFDLSSHTGLDANLIARGLIAVIAAVTGLAVAIRPVETPVDLIWRAMICSVVIFLVSPAQFPWYYVWIAPFLVFFPLPGLLLIAVTMPLYYVAFSFMAHSNFELFNAIVIWIVWCPVWALLAGQAILQGPLRRGRAAATLTGP
ncbi:MAG: glycosyltransferase 87 family protein, partial [Hyphomicrobiaceae bacterium]